MRAAQSAPQLCECKSTISSHQSNTIYSTLCACDIICQDLQMRKSRSLSNRNNSRGVQEIESLSPREIECVSGDCQGSVHDNLFAQDCRYDVVLSSKWREYVPIGHLANRIQ